MRSKTFKDPFVVSPICERSGAAIWTRAKGPNVFKFPSSVYRFFFFAKFSRKSVAFAPLICSSLRFFPLTEARAMGSEQGGNGSSIISSGRSHSLRDACNVKISPANLSPHGKLRYRLQLINGPQVIRSSGHQVLRSIPVGKQRNG